MKQKPLRDKLLREHLSTIAGDGTDLYLMADGTVRLAFVHGTRLVNRMTLNHDLSGTAALVLGQAYILTLLAASTIKDHDTLALLVESDGPVGGLSVEANSMGQVRGYLKNNEIRLSESGSVAEIFGAGTLSVLRMSGEDRTPFQGRTEWQRGDLTENLAWYYATSEQTATVLDVNVHFGEDKRVLGAAGLIVQALPGAEMAILEEIAAAMAVARPLGAAFAAGATSAGLVQKNLAPWNPQLIGTRPAEFYCGCSHDRFARFLAALPAEERTDILENGPIPLRTTCHNCNSTYRFEREELIRLFSAPSDAG
jgi:molecular chaperone Hsp33